MQQYHRHTLSAILITAVLGGGLAGCESSSVIENSSSPGSVVGSDQVRQSAAAPEGDALTTFTQSNQDFALSLYQQLRSDNNENLAFSPVSLQMAMSRAWLGARGDTATEISGAMQFNLPAEDQHSAMNHLDSTLTSIDSDSFQLNISNDIWGQVNSTWQTAYLDGLARHYGQTIQTVDFGANPQGVADQINQYIAEQTNQRIKDLIDSSSLDSMTRLLMTNTVYFNAKWQRQFDPAATLEQPFQLLDGSEAQVSMMRNTNERLQYVQASDYQAVTLPYETGAASMLLILPDAGSFDSVTGSLNGATLRTINESLEQRVVHISLPRFEFSAKPSMAGPLEAMGMPGTFTNSADFSGMIEGQPLKIDEIKHQAFIRVDEEGTEAAAATSIEITATSVPINPVSLVFDRPFIFAIVHEGTDSVLFLGHVTNPGE